MTDQQRAGVFADRLIQRTRALKHPLCVGLDPFVDRIPACFGHADDPIARMEAFFRAVLDRLEGRIAIVKPQIGFFEPYGWRGIKLVEDLVAHARERGLLVLIDAKRGDIGSTAEGYARAWLSDEGAGAGDALTVNPYLGRDTLEPFLQRLEPGGRGLFVLVKTSNPGSADYQNLDVDGLPLYRRVALSLADAAERFRGAETGWSSVGIVAGATWPGEADAIRENLPHSIFLVPGYGAQGAGATEAVAGFVSGPDGLEGGIVNASRSILYPAGSETDDSKVWEAAFDAGLSRAIEDLGTAVSR